MTGRLKAFYGACLRPWITDAPVVVRVALAVLASAWLALVALLVAWGPGDHPGRDVWLYLAVMVTSAALVLARGVKDRVDRPVWIALGAALAASAAGDLAYSLAVSGTEPELFPSFADAFYLAYYPLCLFGVVEFVRRRVRDVPAAVWLDGTVLAVAVGALVGAVFLSPLSGSLTGGASAVVVGAAYPIGDTVVLLITALGVALVGASRARTLVWIGAAMAVSAVADLAYWNLLAVGGYVEGGWIDALWPLSSILFAVGAWLPASRHVEAATGSRGLLVVPGAGLVAATATLAYGTVAAIPTVTVVLAVAALAGVLHRLHATVRSTLLMMEARRDAATDDLTGLPNRRGFTAQAEERLAQWGAAEGATLLLADLDGFKEVNDSLGHIAGDEVLCAVSARLVDEVADCECVLGRLGGDEFAVLVAGSSKGKGKDYAARLARTFALPITVEGMSVSMTASIGSASSPRDGTELSDLLRRADIAMYRAKAESLAHAVFSSRVDLAGEDRLQRVAELRDAIRDGELVLHYQPKIALDGRTAEGVEALVRWHQKGTELVHPDVFLPLARRAGLMPALTDAVVQAALDQAAQWRAEGVVLPIAVNLPAAALMDGALPNYLAASLQARELPGSALQVEITEEALLRDPTRARSVLGRLHAQGILISIDDYGTGYSSLAYLRELVVDEVKIDQSFVAPMLADARSLSIVKYTIDLAHALGLRVVAEGVEDAAVAEALTRLGCDLGQGHHWTAPLPAAEFADWLSRHGR